MDEINKNKINNNAGAGPQINISVETIESVYHSYSQWRTAKTYLPLTAAEKAEYYKGYDPIIGVKIAGTLSVLFALAVLYVFYKVYISFDLLLRLYYRILLLFSL